MTEQAQDQHQQQHTTSQSGIEQQQGVQGWLKIVIASIFYAGLTVFLLSSIGHVAWFFHLYEPKSDPNDWLAMVPSYGKAGALDLAIFFLAYVAATGQAAEKVLTWTFTALLSGVSLYANYIYAMFFSPEHQSDLWHIEILWGVTTTGWLSPLIASSYPLFAMIFMYLIERVISRKAETPQEMRVRLQALKEKKEIEQEIKAVTKGQVKHAAITAIDSGLDVFHHFKGRLSKKQQPSITGSELTPENATNEQEQEPSSVLSTEQREAIKSTDKTSEGRDHEANHGHSPEGEQTGQQRDQASASSSLSGRSLVSVEEAAKMLLVEQPSSSTSVSGRSLVSVEEAAKMLLIEPKTVETLRNRGILKAHPGNRDRITIASIRAYDEKRARKPKTAIKAPSSLLVDTNQPGLMIVPSESLETGVDKLDLTLAILKEHPEITDEALAERLDLKRPASARFWRLKAYEVIKMPSSPNQEAITEPTNTVIASS
jgi:hypothetical protein